MALLELLRALVPDEPGEWDWRQRGNCSGLLDDTFYPEGGPNLPAAKQARVDAKAICNGSSERTHAACPVRERCLDYALRRNETMGVWGGLSEGERKEARKLFLLREGREGSRRQAVAGHAGVSVLRPDGDGGPRPDPEDAADRAGALGPPPGCPPRQRIGLPILLPTGRVLPPVRRAAAGVA